MMGKLEWIGQDSHCGRSGKLQGQGGKLETSSWNTKVVVLKDLWESCSGKSLEISHQWLQSAAVKLAVLKPLSH